MKLYAYLKFLLVLFAFSMVSSAFGQSIRAERKLIMEGNRLYVERKFKDAAVKYEEALMVNPESAVAKYNLGMSQIRQVVNPKDTTPNNSKLLGEGSRRLSEVASMAREKPGLASKANYNLGNLSFNREDFASAISFYKEALRIDPKDMNARKNLRIAQLKQQQNKQDQNQQNQQNQDQQDKQDRQQDQKQDQQDQKQDQQQENSNDRQQEKEQNINNQTASQILQAIDNKESQTRARVNRANKGEKSEAAGRRTRRW